MLILYSVDDSPHNALGMDTIAMDIVGEIQTELDKIKAGLYGWAVEADQVATAAKDSLDKAEINIKNIFNKAVGVLCRSQSQLLRNQCISTT